MSKSILVIDTPDYCTECPLCVEDSNYRDRCLTLYERIFTTEKPDWCPLKTIPSRCNYSGHPDDKYGDGYADGYNDCIDEILGDETI